MKLEDILHSEYLETDTPESIIRESTVVNEIIKHVLTYIKPGLKKNFDLKSAITECKEDYSTLEILNQISDKIIFKIISEHGNITITEEEEQKKVSKMWELNKNVFSL